jgi:hypothetical protein
MQRSIVYFATAGLLTIALLAVSVGLSPATQAMSWVDSMVSRYHQGSQHMHYDGDCLFRDHQMRRHHDNSPMYPGMSGQRGQHMYDSGDCPFGDRKAGRRYDDSPMYPGMSGQRGQHMYDSGDCPFGDRQAGRRYDDSPMYPGMSGQRGQHMQQMIVGYRGCPMTDSSLNE